MLEMKEEYEQRRNLMVRRLNKMGLNCLNPHGAFYVFPNISSTGLTAEEFSKRLLYEKRVAAVPGTAFSSDPDAKNYIRCSYATGFEELEVALERIAEFVQEIKESGSTS
jgi:aminotransferase